MDRIEHRRHGRSRQQGAVAIWIGVSIVALVTAMFLAIESGRLYFAQRDLQRQANLAALAGVQVASGCNGPLSIGLSGTQQQLAGTREQARALIVTFLQSNGGDPAILTGINGYEPVELGRMKSQGNIRVFEPLPDRDPMITAIRVNLSRSQPTPFSGFILGGGLLKASATAEQPLLGSFTVGSTLLKANLGSLPFPLPQLLCPADNPGCLAGVDIASSAKGLAAAEVTLDALSTALGVSVKDLSDPVTLSQTVVLGQVLNSLAGQLGNTVSSATVTLLQQIAGATGNNTIPIAIGDIIGAVNTATGDLAVTNVLDLLTQLGAATKAGPDGTVQPIELPVNASVTGILSVRAYLRVLQPAQGNTPSLTAQRPGVAKATSSQVRLEIRAALGSIITGLLNTARTALRALGLDVVLTTNIGIDVTIGSATAYLDAISCPDAGSNRGMPVARLSAETGIVRLDAGTFTGSLTPTQSPPLQTQPVDLLTLRLGGTTESVRLSIASIGVGASGRRPLPLPVTEFEALTDLERGSKATYRALGSPPLPANDVDNPQDTAGTPTNLSLTVGLSLQQTGSGLTSVLLNLVNAIVNPLVQSLTPLISAVSGLTTSVIDPVLQGLGIKPGVATVTMYDVVVGRPEKTAICVPGSSDPVRGCPIATASP